MTQYLLAVHSVAGDPAPTPAVMQEMHAAVEAFNEQVRQAGAWVFAGGLQPAETATTVRLDDGEVLVTDGPFAASKVQLGGFWIVDVADLDAALGWAERGALACRGAVEVRPFQSE